MKPRVDKNTPELGVGSDIILSEKAIRAHLNRILVNKEFHATDKMRDFLLFVVEETLAGRSRQLKGFTIATEVYGRGTDFDAAHDPVVRIQAGRLRRAIERYYLVAGVHDPIRIEIPKGSYVPVFTAGSSTGKTAKRHTVVSDTHTAEPWPTILVTPFKNITGKADLDYLVYGLSSELCAQLGNYRDLRVVCQRDNMEGVSQEIKTTRFDVRGIIHSDSANVKISVQLIDNQTRQQLWTEKVIASIKSINLIAFQEDLTQGIAAHIASERGIIPRTLSAQLEPRSTNLTTHEAMLKAYTYDYAPSAKSFLEAFEALQAALKKDPLCGLASGRLALLYAENISLEFFDLQQTPLEDAVRIAQAGVQLEPGSQFNRLVLGRVRMLNDELGAALVEVEEALKLHPKSLQFMDSSGYMLMLLGQWERGAMLIHNVVRHNPFYRLYVHYGTWLNWFRQHEYQRALQELELTLGSGEFWEPLARAATFGQLGKTDEAHRAVEELLTLKPDFPARGKMLIGHYVKFSEIADKIVEGLEKTGLNLEQSRPLRKPPTHQPKQPIAEL